ncbi:MAG TPA: hypothetical protein VHQ47_16050 [Phycisphaerae bacterium]|jgi:hypothetical protein|nr:hypothetical protein [Phycisphaerae bacterium]
MAARRPLRPEETSALPQRIGLLPKIGGTPVPQMMAKPVRMRGAAGAGGKAVAAV